ncbi:MAG: AraC family transcriptional regulator, partial [bacterium]|nr:AraC family transcriptional regulator [bacterium]
LAPAALREILYLALRGDQGHLLRQTALRDGRSQGVTRALRYIQENLEYHSLKTIPNLIDILSTVTILLISRVPT